MLATVYKLIDWFDIADLLRLLIPFDLMCAGARMHGRFIHLVRRRGALAVRHNLLETFGHTKSKAEIDLLTRQFFEYKQLRSLLLTLSQRWDVSRISDVFQLEGIEHLEQALAQKRGVFLLGSHLNALCIFPVIIVLRGLGYDVRVARSRPDNPLAPSLLRRAVNRLTGAQTLAERTDMFYCQFNIRPIVKSLEENAIVAQTGDGWHSARFVEVEFLGRKLPFTTGIINVAQMTGASVVPFFQVGAPPDGLRCVFEEPFLVERGERPEEEVRKKVTSYVKQLERHVLGNVSCWEYWLIENTLDTMETWPKRSLAERYASRQMGGNL